MQMQFFPLIDVSSGTYTGLIRFPYQIFRRKIYYKLSGFHQHSMGVPLLSNGNGEHSRCGADCSCPGHRKHVAFPFFILTSHQHRRHRIQHISGLPHFLGHRASFLPKQYNLLYRVIGRKASEGGSHFRTDSTFQAGRSFPRPGNSEETIPLLTEATP